jgi:protein-L-isoaspartate(D-aspartate) O-methyltransferase
MDREVGLRNRMVEHLQRSGVLNDSAVAAAMRRIPRHRFLPGVPLEAAYADRAVALKTTESEVVSSISQPGMIALMLELLSPRAGNTVLEVGTGSGYNAALLSQLVGSTGSVTSIELDADLAHRAQAALREDGDVNVRVVAGDGAGAVEGSFDRVIVTARSEDIAEAWWDATAPGGRIVVPLRLESAGEYAVGFVRERDGLRSCGLYPCAFIPLRGESAAPKSGEVFYRRAGERGSSGACVRRVAEITAVRRRDATPELLGDADVVIARPVSVFAVRFA